MNFSRRCLPLALLPTFVRGQPGVGEAEWKRFLLWFGLPHPEIRGGPPGVLAEYKKKLLADGISPADADRIVGRLRSRTETDPEFMRLNFNRIYTTADGQNESRTTLPNAFLAEVVAAVRPGKALDLGMGMGRNTIFLAQKGWDTTGIDLSDYGVAKAKERANSLGVRIDARVEDVNRFDLGMSQWDLICVLYFVIDESMPKLHQRIAAALKPNGLVIVEGVGSGGTIQALLEAWSKWESTKLRLLRLEYREGKSDWGGSGIGNGIGRILLQRST